MEEAGLKLVAEGANQFFSDMDKAGKSVDEFGNSTGNASKGASSLSTASGGLGKALSGLAPIALSVGAALVGAFVGAGVAAFDFASQTNQATNDIQSSLGITRDAAEELTDVARNVFGNNFGTDIDDVTQSLITVRQQMKGLADEDLQGVTEKALALRDVFAVEVSESTAAAGVLMDQFGLSGDEAMNLITTGFQRGLNTSGDFLESITEYGNLFADNGFTASEFFSTLETGLQGGVLGTDKAADAFKEFGIRIQEMSEDVFGPDGVLRNTLGMTDEEVTKLFDGLEDGSITVADAYKEIMPRLAELDNEVWKNTAGVALFGTQWEDMGADAILAIDVSKTGLEDMAGASDTLNAKYTNLGSVGETMWRQTLLTLEPVGKLMLDIANAAMPAVLSGFEKLRGALESGVTTLTNFAGALQGDKQALEDLPGPLQAVVGGIESAKGAIDTFNQTEFGRELREGAGVVAAYFQGDFQKGVNDGVTKAEAALNRIAESDFGQRLQRGAGVVAAYFANEWPAQFQRGLDKVGTAIEPWLAERERNWSDGMKAAGIIADYFLDEWPAQFERGIKKAGQFFEDLKNQLLTMGPDFIGASNNIGTAIIDGIIAGLDAASGGLFSTIAGIINSALGSAEDEAEIGSPSKLFAREVGEPIAEGIAQGILDGLDSVTGALDTLGDEALKSVEGLANQAGQLFGDTLSGRIGLLRGAASGLDVVGGLYDQFYKLDKEAATLSGFDLEQNRMRRNDLLNRIGLVDQQMEQARAEAAQIGAIDPTAGAEFLARRQQQIAEIAKLEEALANAQRSVDRERLTTQLDLVRRAQALELEQLRQSLTGRAGALGALGDDLGQTGNALIDGLIAGFQERGDQLATSLETILLAAFDKLREKMGIASPSRVTADLIGAPLAEGVAAGFLAAAAGAGSLMAAATGAMLQPAASAASISSMAYTTSSSSVYSPQFNYSPTYQGAPPQPSQDFAVMRSMYGGR